MGPLEVLQEAWLRHKAEAAGGAEEWSSCYDRSCLHLCKPRHSRQCAVAHWSILGSRSLQNLSTDVSLTILSLPRDLPKFGKELFRRVTDSEAGLVSHFLPASAHEVVRCQMQHQ